MDNVVIVMIAYKNEAFTRVYRIYTIRVVANHVRNANCMYDLLVDTLF